MNMNDPGFNMSNQDTTAVEDLLRSSDGLQIKRYDGVRVESQRKLTVLDILRTKVPSEEGTLNLRLVDNNVLRMEKKSGKFDDVKLEDVVAVFPSADIKDGVVVLSAELRKEKTRLDVNSLRFSVLSSQKDDVIQMQDMASLIQAKKGSPSSDYVANNLVQTPLSGAGEAAAEIVKAADKAGKKIPSWVSSVFCLILLSTSTNETIQKNKANLIVLVNAWKSLKSQLAEVALGQAVRKLAEWYFSIPGTPKARDSEALVTAIETLSICMQSPAVAKLVDRVDSIDGLMEVLVQCFDVRLANAGPPASNLPVTPALIGREKDLEKLRAQAKAGTMTAISGDAGVGKSLVANRFAREWVQEEGKPNRFVFWLSSNTETDIRGDYVKVMKRMGIKPKPAKRDSNQQLSTKELARRVWEKLAGLTQFEWMVVFDNAPDVEGPEKLLPWFFPAPLENFGRGRILFTTQSEAYRGTACLGKISAIELQCLSQDDGVKMLLKDIVDDQPDDEVVSEFKVAAGELVSPDHFNGLPLPIAVAQAQIIVMETTVRAYVNKIKSSTAADDTAEDKTLYAVKSALKWAQSSGLGDSIAIAAFVSPDQIPVKLLGRNDHGIQRLCKLNLLRLVRFNVYSMHRLIQEVARKESHPFAAVTAIKKAFTDFKSDDTRTWREGVDLIPHVEALAAFIEYRGGIDSLKNEAERIDYAQVVRMSAQVYGIAMGDAHARLAKEEEALEIYHQVYGRDAKNERIADVLYGIGEAHRYLGDTTQTHAKYEEALEMYRALFGTDDKRGNMATVLTNLGSLYNNLGNYEQAQEMYEEAMEIYKHMDDKDTHQETIADILFRLGQLYGFQCDYVKARSKFEEALDIYRGMYGKDAKNEDIASVLFLLGIMYTELGDNDEARTRYEEALEIYRKVYASNSKQESLSSVLYNLGLLHSKLGDYDEAHAFFDEAMKIYWKLYGKGSKNENIAILLYEIGTLHRELGEYIDARAKYEEALGIFYHVYGRDAKHEQIAKTLFGLGLLYKAAGESSEARVRFVESLDIYRFVYGKDIIKHERVADVLLMLSHLHRELGDNKEARIKSEEALQIYEQVYGKNTANDHIANVLCTLGHLYRELGETREACAKYDEALVIYQRVYGTDSKNVHMANVFLIVGHLNRELGDYIEARGKFEEALRMYRNVYGSDCKNDTITNVMSVLSDMNILIWVRFLCRFFMVVFFLIAAVVLVAYGLSFVSSPSESYDGEL